MFIHPHRQLSVGGEAHALEAFASTSTACSGPFIPVYPTSVDTLPPMTRLRLLGMAIALSCCSSAFLSCSLLVDIHTAQCSKKADCRRLGLDEHICVESMCVESKPEQETRFLCQQKPWPEPNDDEHVDYQVKIEQLMGSTPFKNIEVRACPSLDTECKKPFAKERSDRKGRVSFDLPVGYRGHLHLVPPEDDPSVIPVSAFIFPPPSKDASDPKLDSIVVAHLETLQDLAKQANQELDQNGAHLIFEALDCDSHPLDHVEITTSVRQEKTWGFYIGPSGQIDPGQKYTGPSGRGAILNLPPGFVTVTGTHTKTGKIFEETIYVLPGTMSSVAVVPSPILDIFSDDDAPTNVD